MDEILESLAELVRSLSRLHNNNKGLLLKCDIDRLEKAKAILSKNATGDERGRVKPSNDASALPIPDVSQQSELLIDFINWYDQLGKDLFDEDGYDILVNHYLKSINCG